MNNPLEILIITGPCAVGKTTTAIEWAKSKEGAIIECDYLTEWIYKKDFPHWTEEEELFTANLSVIMAFEYLRKGMSVAIENVWSPKVIEAMRIEFFRASNLKVKSVRLVCDLEENNKRDAQRIPENQMKERVGIVSKELEDYHWPSHTPAIDTTKMTVKEVIDKIETLN